MLTVDGEIEQRQRQQDAGPSGETQQVEQAPAALLGEDRQTDGRRRHGQAQKRAIDQHDAEIGQPTPAPRLGQGTPWGEGLPRRHQAEHPEQRRQAEKRLKTQDIGGQIVSHKPL